MPEDMPEMGYAEDLDKMEKKQNKKGKKCLKKHKRAMYKLKLTVASNIISHIIEETKVDKTFPFRKTMDSLSGNE